MQQSNEISESAEKQSKTVISGAQTQIPGSTQQPPQHQHATAFRHGEASPLTQSITPDETADASGEKQIVAFLGPVASYTHQAALNKFSVDEFEIKPVITIKDIFTAVQDEQADYGVVPFENSSNGSVPFTLDLFADLTGRHPDIEVCGETFVPVRHCLLGRIMDSGKEKKLSTLKKDGLTDDGTTSTGSGVISLVAADAALRKVRDEDDYDSHSSGRVTPTQARPDPGRPRARPSHDTSHVRRLYSHPQAWGQCKHFLDYYFKGVEQEDASSTSKAAEIAARDESGTSAAISSKIAAEVHGLDVLAEGIQDVEDNATRFLIITKRRQSVGDAVVNDGEVDEKSGMRHYKSLISFTVSHEQPGALVDSLLVFKNNNLNLTSIPTRPVKEAWHYIFFVECNGRKRPNGRGGAVNDALNDLAKVAQSHRWLGSWENPLSR